MQTITFIEKSRGNISDSYSIRADLLSPEKATEPSMITTNLTQLPAPHELKNICRSLALLDAILYPKWEYRRHSFNAHWGEHEQMASIRNSEGDHLFIHFSNAGTIIKGFTKAAQSRLQKADFQIIPSEFAYFISEPAFVLDETSFMIWRKSDTDQWSKLTKHDNDGSQQLLSTYTLNPQSYQLWAQAYFQKQVPLSAITSIYNHQPITKELILKLNPNYPLDSLEDTLKEIGYHNKNS